MKKTIYIIITFIIISCAESTLNAQTVLRTENFESFTTGDYVVNSDTISYWSTFFESEDTIQDALVLDDTAVSGNNSLHIEVNNNVVYKLGKRTEGRYQLQFNAFVKQYALGFFRVAQEFPNYVLPSHTLDQQDPTLA